MYATLIAAALVALPIFAATSPTGKFTLKRQNNCSTGPIQCCNQVEASNTSTGDALLGFLNIDADPSTFFGFDCSPISVLGGAVGSECQNTPVCCENNSVGGLINIGCIPIVL